MISMQRNSPEPQNHQNHQIRRNLWLLCGHFWPSFTLDQPRNSNALRRVTNSVQLCTYVLLQPSIIDPCACYIFTWFHLSVHVCAQIQTLDQSSFLLVWKYSQNELGCLYCMLPRWARIGRFRSSSELEPRTNPLTWTSPYGPKMSQRCSNPLLNNVFWGCFILGGRDLQQSLVVKHISVLPFCELKPMDSPMVEHGFVGK